MSMAWGAARKLRQTVANLGRILAVEVSCAVRGLDLRAPLRPAPATAAALAALRARGRGAGAGRFLAPELAAAEGLITRGALLGATEAVIGALIGSRSVHLGLQLDHAGAGVSAEAVLRRRAC